MRLVLAFILAGLTALFSLLLTPEIGRSQGDSCPEPNDDFQAACYLGPGAPTTGILSSADDVDAFRFETLDADVRVQIALLDPPGPYRLNLADWTGKIVGASTEQEGSEVIDVQLGPPGSYYVFVDSRTGAVAAGLPYRLLYQPTYAETPPQLLFSREFRAGASEDGYPPTAEANFVGAGGKVTVIMTVGGSPEAPKQAAVTLGPPVADFTLAVDARMANAETAVDAVYFVGFRVREDGAAYRLLVDLHRSAVRLQLVEPGGVTNLGEWVSSDAIDTQGGVNRLVIRAVGPSIRASMNGRQVLESTGPAAQGGRFQLGIITQGEPPIISYDNALVTTPGR